MRGEKLDTLIQQRIGNVGCFRCQVHIPTYRATMDIPSLRFCSERCEEKYQVEKPRLYTHLDKQLRRKRSA